MFEDSSLQRQPELPPLLDSGIPRAVAWNRRPVARTEAPGTTYPATATAVGAARREVARSAGAAGACELVLMDIELAVGEALTNAVLHAYAANGVRGNTFTVSTAADGPLFSVWVTDAGQGATPDVPSSGLGLGLQLMAKLCERLEVGVLPDGRSQVELRFDLRSAFSAPSSSARTRDIVGPSTRAPGSHRTHKNKCA